MGWMDENVKADQVIIINDYKFISQLLLVYFTIPSIFKTSASK
jgi:hypothetical protein